MSNKDVCYKGVSWLVEEEREQGRRWQCCVVLPVGIYREKFTVEDNKGLMLVAIFSIRFLSPLSMGERYEGFTVG